MSVQDDPKFDFKAPEENIRKWQPKKWENDAFQGVSPFDFAMRQKNEEKKRKEREREAKARMYNYQSKGVASLEEANALKVNAENEKAKQAARQNKEDATQVNMAASGFGLEQASRDADHRREKDWKETKKNELESHKVSWLFDFSHPYNLCPWYSILFFLNNIGSQHGGSWIWCGTGFT